MNIRYYPTNSKLIPNNHRYQFLISTSIFESIPDHSKSSFCTIENNHHFSLEPLMNKHQNRILLTPYIQFHFKMITDNNFWIRILGFIIDLKNQIDIKTTFRYQSTMNMKVTNFKNPNRNHIWFQFWLLLFSNQRTKNQEWNTNEDDVLNGVYDIISLILDSNLMNNIGQEIWVWNNMKRIKNDGAQINNQLIDINWLWN